MCSWKPLEGQGWSPDHPEPIAPFPHSGPELLISEQQIYDSLCYVQYFCKIYSENIWEKAGMEPVTVTIVGTG